MHYERRKLVSGRPAASLQKPERFGQHLLRRRRLSFQLVRGAAARRVSLRRRLSSVRFGFLLQTQTWGVGYALDNCTEWQEVFKTAAKTAVVLMVLDMLRLTRNSKWFEEHVDFVSMQALLFNGAARGWWAQTHKLVKLQARLTED